MENSRIAFIGAGNMANSLIKGLLAKGVTASNILACDIDQDKLATLERECGITASTLQEAAIQADVLVLAVKPQVLGALCRELNDLPGKRDSLVISIAAGISLQALESWLGSNRAIVRTMPNTPSLVGEGATALFANTQTDEDQKQLAEAILSAVGISSWLRRESDIDTVTALSGSGPAYYFLLMEAMEKAAIDMGLDAEIARRFAIQTALGAGRLASADEDGPETLRRRVMSPGGTTEKAIESFTEDGFTQSVEKAMRAAAKRSAELAAKA